MIWAAFGRFVVACRRTLRQRRDPAGEYKVSTGIGGGFSAVSVVSGRVVINRIGYYDQLSKSCVRLLWAAVSNPIMQT